MKILRKINRKKPFMFGELSKFPEHAPLSPKVSGLKNILRQFAPFLAILVLYLGYTSCKLPVISQVPNLKTAPSAYTDSADSTNSADLKWREFFTDTHLIALIETALNNNPDVLMTLKDIEIAQNKVQVAHGALLPSVRAGGGMGIEKVGRYTSQGAGDASADITPGFTVPDNLTDINLAVRASWEIDIWGKLRNAKQSAFTKYLSSIEGKNFVLTNLIAEIAHSYYELLALDNQLTILKETIELQKAQLEVVKIQKQAAVVTELAVKQFEAQVYKLQSMEFDILQNITENESKINFLLGRYPQKIERDTTTLTALIPNRVKAGIPSQLLRNRPDIKQAELDLLAAKLDVKTAQLEFYPSVGVSSSLGTQAFRPGYLLRLPESLLYSLVSDMAGPIINRHAITAEFKSANAEQIKALYNYQKTIVNGYVEVTNELSNINNLEKTYEVKLKQVEVLTKSIEISNDLFKYARANYLEVLSAQREALDAKLELVEIKQRIFMATTNVYKALGGGWK